jgi:uncharacterized protein (DUF362 family)
MNRREFVQKISLVSGSVLLSPLLNACRQAGLSAETASLPGQKPVIVTDLPPTSTAALSGTATNTTVPEIPPTPTEKATAVPTTDIVAGSTAIALVKTTNRTFGVQRALELLALQPARGLPVLLKPNYNSADPAPASTHPDTLRAIITALQDQGARAITIGERSGMGDTRQVLAATGVLDMANELGVATAVFDELAPDEWVIREDSDFHWSDGIPVPRLLLDSPCVVQTCNLKTHRYGGHFTLSLKNSIGLVAKTVQGNTNFMSQLHNSRYQREMIAESNALYAPALIIVDGVSAFVDGGPAAGTLRQAGVILAGTDRIAIDAVGVAILRLLGTTPEVSDGRIFAQTQIARAVELGLGISMPEQIHFVTGDRESADYAAQISALLAAG